MMPPDKIVHSRGCGLSIIIPVVNEAHIINRTLMHLSLFPSGPEREIIVVDGEPRGDTLKAIRHPEVVRITSRKGRGSQMNAGARMARGRILLFLHADTLLPDTGLSDILRAFQDPDVRAGAFALGIASPRKRYRILAAAATLRSRITRIPYGDQAIFIDRSYFFRRGGFGEIPLMEDVDLMRRISRAGGKIILLSAAVTTSSRRWETEGLIYGTFRNWLLLACYLGGVSPVRLARFYRPVPHQGQAYIK